MNHIVAKNSKDIEASGNELILDDDSQSEPMWYQKPLGVVAITVISGVLVALVIKAINHFTGSDLG